ncbi:TPA: hypothetical protein QB224_001002 [Pasteurella multocida]|nr:hypothetical protein [Pasteurella multocida]
MKKLVTLAALASALTMAATAPAQAEMKSAGNAEQCVEGKCLKTKMAEGKCGEGKCGAHDHKAKAAEGKCGAHDHKAKAAEGKCGEGKCGSK